MSDGLELCLAHAITSPPDWRISLQDGSWQQPASVDHSRGHPAAAPPATGPRDNRPKGAPLQLDTSLREEFNYFGETFIMGAALLGNTTGSEARSRSAGDCAAACLADSRCTAWAYCPESIGRG